MFRPHGCNVYLAEEIKKHVSVPVATLGAERSGDDGRRLSRPGKPTWWRWRGGTLADHELPRKVMANRDEDIVKCLRCFTCIAERAVTSTRRCTVNPLIGDWELDGTEVLPAANRKSPGGGRRTRRS